MATIWLLQGASLWGGIEAALTSGIALRLYVVATAVAVLGASLWFAYTRREAIIELRPFRGRPPVRAKAIEARIRALTTFQRRAAASTIFNLAAVILFGFLVPAAALVLGLHYYAWFFPGQSPLVGGVSGQGLSFPSLAAFVLSQWTMGLSGVASDALSRTTALGTTYTPADNIVALAIGVFRYFVALFGGVFAHLLYAALRAPSRAEVQDQLKEWVEQLKYAR